MASNADQIAFQDEKAHEPIFSGMTQKEIVLDAINELPDDASLDEIAERVDFPAAIQKGLDEL